MSSTGAKKPVKHKSTPLADLISQRVRASISVKQLLLEDEDYQAAVQQAGLLMAQSLAQGGRIFFCGNGGSAADAQHLAAELTGRFLKERRSLAGMTLTANTSALTAIGNDYSFDEVFSRQLEGLARPGDVIVAISTSGNSPNVLRAMETARGLGVKTIALTGKSGGKLAAAAEYCIRIPSSETPRIQESHILTGHILMEIIEAELFGD
jgi:D-sedoheptulose 7-phosphate isomerase